MVDPIYFIPLAVSFIATLILTPFVIRFMKQRGIVGEDLNKLHRPKIAEMGGIAVLIGFFSGVFIFLSLFRRQIDVGFMATLLAISGCAFTGLLDDLKNLRKYIKAVLPFFFALPMGIMLQGITLAIPSLGIAITSSWVVPLLIAFGITCGANSMNMLDGFNGLSAGLTLIAGLVLTVVATVQGKFEALWLLLPLIGAITAFLVFNSYPASVFPGDTFTLFAGGTVVAVALVNDMIVWGIILFIPMIVNFTINLRFMFDNSHTARNQGKPGKDGYLYRPAKKIEALPHCLMWIRPMKEWQIVGVFWLIELGIGFSVIGYGLNCGC